MKFTHDFVMLVYICIVSFIYMFAKTVNSYSLNINAEPLYREVLPSFLIVFVSPITDLNLGPGGPHHTPARCLNLIWLLRKKRSITFELETSHNRNIFIFLPVYYGFQNVKSNAISVL